MCLHESHFNWRWNWNRLTVSTYVWLCERFCQQKPFFMHKKINCNYKCRKWLSRESEARDYLGRSMLEITMQVLADYFPFLLSPHLHVMQFQTNQSVIANFLFIPFFVIWNPIFISSPGTRLKSPSQLQFYHWRLRASNVLRCTSVRTMTLSVSICFYLSSDPSITSELRFCCPSGF